MAGKRKKYGGRKAGTPNKVTTDLREQISELIENNFKGIQKDIDNLESKERLDFLIKLFEYSLPKLNRTEIDGNLGYRDIGFSIRDIYKFTDEQEEERENTNNLVTFK